MVVKPQNVWKSIPNTLQNIPTPMSIVANTSHTRNFQFKHHSNDYSNNNRRITMMKKYLRKNLTKNPNITTTNR